MSFFPVFVSLVLISCTSHKKIGIIENKCGTCHDTDRIYSSHKTKDQWDILVNGMKIRGLVVTPAEEKQIKSILYTQFGNGK